MHPIQKAFGPLYGQPSYLVHQGYASYITLEFGAPRLSVDGPNDRPHSFSTKDRRKVPHRLAYVRGEWHLWIYSCAWTLYWEGKQLAHSESSRPRIARGLALLNGQALTEVLVDSSTARTTFSFDLGCTVYTQPYTDAEPDDPQWILFEPSGYALSVRPKGLYSHHRANLRPGKERWRPLPPAGLT